MPTWTRNSLKLYYTVFVFTWRKIIEAFIFYEKLQIKNWILITIWTYEILNSSSKGVWCWMCEYEEYVKVQCTSVKRKWQCNKILNSVIIKYFSFHFKSVKCT
jgi:hypothetical protein